jgi:hypothetical protein
MSLEHSPARRNKNVPRSALGCDENERIRGPPIFPYDLLTRGEVADRLRTTPITVTRKYKKWGLKPARLGGRVLLSTDQILALEKRLMESGEES